MEASVALLNKPNKYDLEKILKFFHDVFKVNTNFFYRNELKEIVNILLREIENMNLD